MLAPHLPSTFVLAAHWNYLLTKVADLETDESDELLGEIVDKWVKIRGHSFASGWIDQYQIAAKQDSKNLYSKLVTLIMMHRVKELNVQHKRTCDVL